MQLNTGFAEMGGEEVWEIVTKFINENKFFHSVRRIKYSSEVMSNAIFYKGGDGNRGSNGETISKADFCEAFDNVKNMSDINTSSIKDSMPKSIYAKRTPFIGLLLSANIIKK